MGKQNQPSPSDLAATDEMLGVNTTGSTVGAPLEGVVPDLSQIGSQPPPDKGSRG